MVSAPFDMPEDPTPAMALPMMNMGELWAAPHKRDPTSKTKKKARKDHYDFRGRVRACVFCSVRSV